MKHQSLFILGRQPAIGRAELESLFGADHLEPAGETAIAGDMRPEDVDFTRIGGSMRLARPVAILPASTWTQAVRLGAKELPGLIDLLPVEGKVKLGVSTFGLPVQGDDIFRAGLSLKKAFKARNRSVRLVPNTAAALNSAQVLYNQLIRELGIELLFVRMDDNRVYLAQTLAVQDIDAYAARDQARPKRDSRVGMLPPKLAQIIVNLAAGPLPPTSDTVVLDPFCGTGVLLQEALLMGYGAYGSDLEPRMVDYSRANLEWLATRGEHSFDPRLETGDATAHTWKRPVSAVATETYLGHPFTLWPEPEQLHNVISTCNLIVQKFLQNIAGQLESGTRLCLAMPAWKNPDGRLHRLPLLDQISDLGYNRISFSWADAEEMIYHRPSQIVARELLVIARK